MCSNQINQGGPQLLEANKPMNLLVLPLLPKILQ